MEYGVPDLSLNLMMYLENCAWEEDAKINMNMKKNGTDLFM
jgi:hypothetical protein